MILLLYLGKVILCSGILLGYYWLFLRNKRFHHYNRFFLLGALVIPVLLPFLKIGIGMPKSTVNQVVYQTLDVLTVNYGESDGLVNGPSLGERLLTTENLLYLVYAAGIVTLLALMLRSLFYIRSISRRYPYEVVNRLKVYSTTEPGTPFSFFRSVFWNQQLSFNSEEGQQIFRHEFFHVQQKHSSDIMLAEIVTALFWCNPFFHIIKKELKAIHEFLADQYAISGNDRFTYAELLVLQTMQQRSPALTHRFFQNHIKRRIAMITHLNTTKYSYWTRLMVLPLAVVLFCGFALYTRQPAFNDDPAKDVINVVIDAGHGGIDGGAASPDGKFLEKDLNLVISQKIQQLAPGYNVNVIMTRSGDVLPSGASKVDEGLKARLALADQHKADLFVSIHVSAAGTAFNDKWSGFEAYIGTNEEFTQASTRLGSAILQSLGTLYATNPVIKQRNEKGIYVLNKSNRPSVLIECGYITNPKDLEFLGKESNLEATAKKILEGIVAYRKLQPVAAWQDTTLVQKISRHFNRNIRYPEKARTNRLKDVAYFSLDVDKNAVPGNFQLYNEAPVAADKISELATVTFVTDSVKALPITEQERSTILREELKRVGESLIEMGTVAKTTPATYYFKHSFMIE